MSITLETSRCVLILLALWLTVLPGMLAIGAGLRSRRRLAALRALRVHRAHQRAMRHARNRSRPV